jgi:hemerythrin
VVDTARDHFLAEEALLANLPKYSQARFIDHQAQHALIVAQLVEMADSADGHQVRQGIICVIAAACRDSRQIALMRFGVW